MIDDQQVEPVFIPVLPLRQKLFGLMVFNSIPGFILIVSGIVSHPETVGALLLSVICVLSGIAVIYFSIKQFLHHRVLNWLSSDSVTVFAGLLIIAQGSMIFDATKGFQPAHLLFAAAAIYIFKGVMLPETTFKKGITISDAEIVYRKSVLRKQGPFPSTGIRQIGLQGNLLRIEYNDNNTKHFDLTGTMNPEEVVKEMQKILIPL